MIKVLFICHGNICRSPMAEFIMKDLIHKAHIEHQFEVASAATHYDEIGSPVYPPARRKLAEHGISCSGKTARLLQKSDYAHYNHIIGMDHANLRNMNRICCGDPDNKFSLLLEWCGEVRDVADPWYSGNFEATWEDVTKGCAALLAQLIK